MKEINTGYDFVLDLILEGRIGISEMVKNMKTSKRFSLRKKLSLKSEKKTADWIRVL